MNFKMHFSWEWLFHATIWLGWIIFMNTGDANGFGYYSQTKINILGPLILNTSLNAIYFYLNTFYLVPLVYNSKVGIRYFYLFLLFPLIFFLLKTSAEQLYIYFFIPHLHTVSFGELAEENIYSLPLFVILSFLYFQFKKNEQEKAWLIQEKTQKELALLRAQLSPHFLFNTLNNLYSLGEQGKQKEVNAGILKLSEILRYILYDSQSEQVLLEQELRYIHDFIEINKLMFAKNHVKDIKFSLSGNTAELCIQPMILLTFVENAFKFGQGNRCDPLIEVNAEIVEENLHFRVKNKICKRVSTEERSQGLGLKNTKRQLELLYPDRHQLNILDDKGFFYISLRIELKS